MRGSFLRLILLVTALFFLTSCTKSIECPSDELKMFSWSGILDNGTEVDLRFGDHNGYLDIDDGGEPLHIGGLCMSTDDSFLIFDEQSGMNYSFSYRLHGDRVELIRNGSVLVLEKNDSH